MPSKLSTALFFFAAILIPVSAVAAVCVAAVALLVELFAFVLGGLDDAS